MADAGQINLETTGTTRPLELTLLREEAESTFTLGRLFIDGQWMWFSLEDRLHLGDKIPGATAIPAGRYQVVITESKRFGRPMPLLVGVPGFGGVRIHPGNTDRDTSGCILLGGGYNRPTGALLHSRYAVDQTQRTIAAAIAAGRQVWLTIENKCTPWATALSVVATSAEGTAWRFH